MNKQNNVLDYRVARRAFRILSLIIASSVPIVASRSAYALDSPILWPSMGAFPAYPREEDVKKLRLYADAMVAHDDNIFRISDDAPPPVGGIEGRGDTFVRGSTGVEARLKNSRQEFVLSAQADHYTFDKFSMLDRWLYEGDINWRWMVGDRLKGDIGYQTSLEYPDFSELQYVTDDVIRLQYAHVGFDLRAIRGLTIRALLEGSDAKHDDPTRAELNNRVKSATVGLFYVGNEGGSIGVQHKVSDGDYPNSQLVGSTSIYNKYREYESSVVLSQQLVDRVSGDLRIGYTKREHEDVPQRDFKGTTGRANLRYAPTGKLMIDLAAYRELRAIEELSASYAVVRGGTIGPYWAPTLKWTVQLAYVYEERELLGNPSIVLIAAVPREDTTRAARAALGYEPSRHLRAVLAFEHGTRSSNVVGADYSHNVASLNVTFSM